MQDEPVQKPKGTVTSALLGSVKEPENFDYKKELEEALTEKHLKNG